MSEECTLEEQKNTASRVRWLPLECNPEVMTNFLHNLGVPKSWALCDVYGLEEELLAMVPQPTVAVLMLYQLTPNAVAAAAAEDSQIAVAGQTLSPDVYFMRQTIGNACGTVALMHALANGRPTLRLDAGPLAEFFERTAPLTPEERAGELERFQLLEAAHEAAGHEGQSRPANRDDKLDTHFIALVHVDGHLYELDGRRPAAVNHGTTSPQTLLADAAVVVRRFMARDPTKINFAVMALAAAQ